MGYETRVFVVAKSEHRPDEGEVLAMVDLCKLGYDGPLAALITERRNSGPWMKLPHVRPNRYQDAIDFIRSEAAEAWSRELADAVEDDQVSTDLYGDKLPAIPFDEFCIALDQELEKSDYRRLLWISALLLSIRQTWDKHRPLVVVTYGH